MAAPFPCSFAYGETIMKHKLISIAVALVFILAAAVAFYPLVSNAMAERNRSLDEGVSVQQIPDLR